jgi:hypothetical protein
MVPSLSTASALTEVVPMSIPTVIPDATPHPAKSATLTRASGFPDILMGGKA